LSPPPHPDELRALADLLAKSKRLFVLTGAGCSTASGIPTYRDEAGRWKRRQPITYAAFTGSALTRRRYWARSLVGYRRMATAQPNAGHAALAQLEALGRIGLLVTQNVDGLHQRAGSHNVLDLHGRVDGVICLGCRARTSRAALQASLIEANPAWADLEAATAPDGDADLERDTTSFEVPGCRDCAGLLKPDLVFFGESVPKDRVERAYAAVASCDALLVVGSSLQVFSGWRFVRAAGERGTPVALLNLGRSRADDLASIRVRAASDEVLPGLVASLSEDQSDADAARDGAMSR